MKNLILISIVMLGTSAFAETIYQGTFNQPQVSAPACNNLLDQQNYTVRHDLTGSNGLTSVLNFQLTTPSSSSTSFLQGVTLIGLYDYDDDFDDDGDFQYGTGQYHVNAQGIADGNLLVADVTVELLDPTTNAVQCTAKAEMTAYPQ